LRRSKSDLLEAESAAVKVLVRPESIPETVYAMHFSSAFQPLAPHRQQLCRRDDRIWTNRQVVVQTARPLLDRAHQNRDVRLRSSISFRSTTAAQQAPAVQPPRPKS